VIRENQLPILHVAAQRVSINPSQVPPPCAHLGSGMGATSEMTWVYVLYLKAAGGRLNLLYGDPPPRQAPHASGMHPCGSSMHPCPRTPHAAPT
jgi:hypothetical protein